MKSIVFKIDEQQFKDIHIRAAERGKSVQDYMCGLIKTDLTQNEAPNQTIEALLEKIADVQRTLRLADDLLGNSAKQLREVQSNQQRERRQAHAAHGQHDMNGKNGWKTHEQVRRIKEQYPPGTRIRLGNMVEEEHAPPSGTEGVVQVVDDMGHLLMKWDNGQTLSLIPGEDSFSIIPRQEQGMTMQMGGIGQ